MAIIATVSGCERAPAEVTPAPRPPALRPPADAMPMTGGAWRGERLGLRCGSMDGPVVITTLNPRPCFLVRWQLVRPDSMSTTANFEPHWRTVRLAEPAVLRSGDTSVVRVGDGFWMFPWKAGQTVLLADHEGATASLPVTVVPPVPSGWTWAVRDTTVPVGQWVALKLVVRDPDAADAAALPRGLTWQTDTDPGAAAAMARPEVIQDWPARVVRVRLLVPGCVTVSHSTSVSVHFIAPPEPVPGAQDRRPSRQPTGCSAREAAAGQ